MNSSRRTTAAVLAVLSVAAVGLTACSSAGTAGGGGGGDDLTVAFVVGASSDPFFQAMKVGAETEAKAQGVKLTFQGDATTYSSATQIPVVNQVLATSPDGLVLGPTDPKALQPVVDRAVSKGIPVVNVDTSVDDLDNVVSFITGDNGDGGSKAADAIANAIGYTNGTTYSVVVGLSSATSTTNVARLDGFKDQIAAKYPGIEIVATGYSESNPATANTNVNNWLTAYPDLAGIFAIDGTNASGAASALQAKGLTGKVALVGYDAYKTNVDLLKQGVFTALIAQDPAQEGKLAVRSIVQTLRKDKAAAEIKQAVTLPNIIIDKNTSAADIEKYTYIESAG
ncbi:substrate-binding domain-containing protein [Plantibacter sp. Mn2098]|uniref:substrate-binding domain-containing protein n=1 Tax=Plantibacter sp. Mn2098 TaxID=3395266 RepID=UPI003BCF8E79